MTSVRCPICHGVFIARFTKQRIGDKIRCPYHNDGKLHIFILQKKDIFIKK